MHLTGYDLFAWAASFIGHVALMLVLVSRGRVREFPFFTCYIIEQIVCTITLYFIFHHLSFRTYQDSYWCWGLVGEVLQILVLYEISVHIFCPTGVWAEDVRGALIGLVSLSGILTLLLACLATPTTSRPVQTFILRSNFFSAMLLSELFVGVLILSMTVGLPWKTHVARIAQGLGAYCSVSVAVAIIGNFAGLRESRHIYTSLAHIRASAYLLCEIYWIVTLWMRAPTPRELPEAMRTQIYTLQRRVENDLIQIRAWRRN